MDSYSQSPHGRRPWNCICTQSSLFIVFLPSFLSQRQNMELICFDLIVALIIGLLTGEVLSTGEVIYAVNNGGPAHTDLNGVHYQADQLTIGVPSDYGKMLTIGRVAPPDQILYQTERYHLSNFGYTIPIKDNGDYVLVLKFCEVYFQAPRLKVKGSFLSFTRVD